MFQVLILTARPESPDNVLFEGQSKSVLLPGAEGEFEILDFHRPIMSRLKEGVIVVDNQKEYRIRGGVASMNKQQLLAIVDL
jgi:F-type H+-transporting ATPase subunit epsilon